MMNWKYVGLFGALLLWGCVDEAPTDAGGAGGSCWYCTGGGGGAGGVSTSTGKGSGGAGGKSGASTTTTIQGQLDIATGDGTYQITSVLVNDGSTICDVSYTVAGAMADATCAQCTFAYAMPLSNPQVVVGTAGCDKVDTSMPVLWGHQDPGTLLIEKSGTWYLIDKGAQSTVVANEWTFSLSYTL